MTLNKKNVKLLLIVLGFLILLLAYFLVYKPYTEKTEQLDNERIALQPELDQLRTYYANLDSYYDGIADSKKIIAEETAKYDDDVRSEDLIMYALKLEDKVGFHSGTLGFGGNSGMMSFDLVTDDGKIRRNVWQTDLSLNGIMTYDQVKSYIDFINNTHPRTSLQSLQLSYNGETGNLSTNTTLSKYFIAGDDYVYEATKISGVPLGTDNLFGAYGIPEGEEEGEEGTGGSTSGGPILLD